VPPLAEPRTAVSKHTPRGLRPKVRSRPQPPVPTEQEESELPVMTVPETGRIPAGWRVIASKEFADHILSIRFLLAVIIIGVGSAVVVYTVAGNLRGFAGAIPTAWNGQAYPIFLALFTQPPTVGSTTLQALTFAAIIANFAGPLLGLTFGFDAISNERSEGTLPRLVSQPIHRDDVINGKFVAGLAVVALIIGAATLLLSGIGIRELGVVPTGEVAARLFVWWLVAALYVGFWLALSTLCSVVFRRGAEAVLVVLALWLVVTFFGGQIASILAGVLSPAGANATSADQLANLNMTQAIQGILPTGLFSNVTQVLLNPAVNSLSLSLPDPTGRAVASLLPFTQSLLLIWPYIIALLAMTAICFAAAYVLFMRQEIRA
jgi:ABC-2 type transport system permease protein